MSETGTAYLILTLDVVRAPPQVIGAAILSVTSEQLEALPSGRVRVTALTRTGASFVEAANALEKEIAADTRWSWALWWFPDDGTTQRYRDPLG